MTTQEKNKVIAEWLELEIKAEDDGNYCYLNNHFRCMEQDLRFLTNRNHQKWIEDKLIEMGCQILIGYDPSTKEWNIHIIDFTHPKIIKFNTSKDIAFIDAVIELIKSK